MHEFSICESLVDAIVTEMSKLDPPASKLNTAKLAVGSMRQIVPDFMKEAYELFTKDTPAAGSKLEIRLIPVAVKCRECGREGELTEMLFQCPSCESTAVEMTSGMELFLESLEVEQPD